MIGSRWQWMAIIYGLASAGAHASMKVQAIHQSPEEVIVEFEFPTIQVEIKNLVNGSSTTEVSLNQIGLLGQEETLQTVFLNRLLFVPHGFKPVVKVLAVDERRLGIKGSLMARSIDWSRCTSARQKFVGGKLDSPFKIGKVQSIFGVPSATLSLLPVRWDKQNSQLIVRKRVVLQIRFAKAKVVPNTGKIQKFNLLVAQKYLNPKMLYGFAGGGPLGFNRPVNAEDGTTLKFGIEDTYLRGCSIQGEPGNALTRFANDHSLELRPLKNNSLGRANQPCHDCNFQFVAGEKFVVIFGANQHFRLLGSQTEHLTTDHLDLVEGALWGLEDGLNTEKLAQYVGVSNYLRYYSPESPNKFQPQFVFVSTANNLE